MYQKERQTLTSLKFKKMAKRELLELVRTSKNQKLRNREAKYLDAINQLKRVEVM